jgi:hypothetical protein
MLGLPSAHPSSPGRYEKSRLRSIAPPPLIGRGRDLLYTPDDVGMLSDGERGAPQTFGNDIAHAQNASTPGFGTVCRPAVTSLAS